MQVVAEIGTNYAAPDQGDRLDLAKLFANQALICGADYVKYQMFTGLPLFCAMEGDHKRRKRWDDCFMSLDQWFELKEHCRLRGIKMFVSPFEYKSVSWAVELKLPYIKVASRAVEKFPYKEVGDIPLIISDGMYKIPDDQRIRRGNMLLQCTSKYPTPLGRLNGRDLMDCPTTQERPGLLSTLSQGVRGWWKSISGKTKDRTLLLDCPLENSEQSAGLETLLPKCVRVASPRCRDSLESDGWRCIEELITYGREPVVSLFNPEVIVAAPDSVDAFHMEATNKALEHIALRTGGNSRLYRDPQVPNWLADDARSRDVINSAKNGKFMFAFDDDYPVGFLSWMEHEDKARIATIAVDPDAAGKGFGSELVKAWMTMMVGKKTVFAGTQSHNPACKFYEGLGFKKVHREWTLHK